jgi:uncharacterized protein YebE (UPF0316 family)
MLKILAIFCIGLLEQVLYTAYLLSVNKKQVKLSSYLMFIYMLFYLGIIAYAIKDNNTITLLLAYAAACGVGNYIMMKFDSAINNQEIMRKYILGELSKGLNNEKLG